MKSKITADNRYQLVYGAFKEPRTSHVVASRTRQVIPGIEGPR